MNSLNQNLTIDNFIKIAILSALLFWGFNIVQPFILLIVWAIIIAVTLYPLVQKINGVFKGKKKKLVTTLFILILIALIIFPTVNATKSIVSTTQELYQNFEEGTIKVNPPNENVKGWPLVGEKLFASWESASADFESFIKTNQEAVQNSVGWLFDSLKGLMTALLMSLVAIIISGIFMSSADNGYKSGVKFMDRLQAGRGVELMNLCTNTIRSVVKGILFVAIIQAILGYLGFVMIGYSSAAGILAIIFLIAAIVQIPLTLVAIPIIAYAFSFAETTPAIIFAIYTIVVALIDNFLKPILLAKGLNTPMIVIFMGAIGGMIYQGLIGLFVGPVILALLYEFYTGWVKTPEEVNA